MAQHGEVWVPGDSDAPVHVCCYLESTEVGGTEVSLSTLLAHLDDRYQVTLVGVRAPVLEVLAASRPGTVIRCLPQAKKKTNASAIFEHLRAVHELRPHLVMACLSQLYDAQYGILAGLANRIPTVGVAHCVLPPVSRSQRWLFGQLAYRLRGLAGVSRSVCSSAERALGLKPGAVTILYNGVPDAGSGALGTTMHKTAGSASSTGAPVIGAVGRLVPEKGFDVLIRALAMLPGARAVLIGEGPERASISALARELGVADRIELPGFVEPPWTARFKLDVLVAPSRVEGFGLAAVEALLARLPVVATRIGGLPEVLCEGEHGVLVDRDDPYALAVAIRDLLADPLRRRAMTERGRASALERFAPAAMARSYEKFFSSALASRARLGDARL